MDGEGTGGSRMKIHHNRVVAGAHSTAAICLEIQADAGHEIYDNVCEGKTFLLYGCAHCDSHDNHVAYGGPASVPVLSLANGSAGYRDHDNEYIRTANAAPGVVVSVAHRISAPSDVVFEDDLIESHVPADAPPAARVVPLQSLGIAGMVLRRSRIVYEGPRTLIGWDAAGTGANGSGAGGIRTTRLELDGSSFEGLFDMAMRISGSYLGTGSLAIHDTSASQALRGLVCFDTAESGKVDGLPGITGPLELERNAMPAASSTCAAFFPAPAP
jgi:hypothetical protein